MAKRKTRRQRKRRKRILRGALIAFGLVWAAQLFMLDARLDGGRWRAYWELRAFYRPGLIAFRNVAKPVLPPDYFAWHSRRGAQAGFVFATALYALPAMPIGMLIAAQRRKRR